MTRVNFFFHPVHIYLTVRRKRCNVKREGNEDDGEETEQSCEGKFAKDKIDKSAV